MDKYIEVVTNLKQRGVVIPLSALQNFVQHKVTEECYISLWRFGEEFKEYVKLNGTIRGFDGIVNFDSVLLDIDYKSDDWDFRSRVTQILLTLDMYEIPEKSYQMYFSGTGIHIELHSSIFGITPSKTANKEIAEIIADNFEGVDNIFDKTRVIRLVNTINLKSNLYKIPITRQEFAENDLGYIRDLAKEPRYLDIKLYPTKTIFKYLHKEDIKDKKHIAKQHVNKYNCIHNILNSEPEKGERHNTGLRLASHFKRQGYNEEVAKAVIKDWINDKSEYKDIDKYVEEIYEDWNSFYSCKDPLLKRYCDKSCIFYDDVSIMNISDMYKEYQMKQEADNMSIDLKDIFTLPDSYKIEAGALTTVLGATGVGKSIFVQNIMARTNIPTLYMSLEMPASQVYERFGLITRNPLNLKHIQLTTKAIYPNELNRILETNDFKMLIVDHIALMKSQHRDEYARIMELTGVLKQLALEYNIIIIGVSQVARESARTNIGLFSGKGSGSIENDSDNVLVYDKEQPTSKTANLYSVKSRNGYTLNTILQLDGLRLY